MAPGIVSRIWLKSLAAHSGHEGLASQATRSSAIGSRRVKVKSRPPALAGFDGARHSTCEGRPCGTSRSRPRSAWVMSDPLVVYAPRHGPAVYDACEPCNTEWHVLAPKCHERGFQIWGTIHDHELGPLQPAGVEIGEELAPGPRLLRRQPDAGPPVMRCEVDEVLSPPMDSRTCLARPGAGPWGYPRFQPTP